MLDDETETSRDWAKDVDTETSSRLLLISDVNLIMKKKKPKVIIAFFFREISIERFFDRIFLKNGAILPVSELRKYPEYCPF